MVHMPQGKQLWLWVYKHGQYSLALKFVDGPMGCAPSQTNIGIRSCLVMSSNFSSDKTYDRKSMEVASSSEKLGTGHIGK